MAGNYRGNPGMGRRKQEPKKIGRGILEATRADGPHTEWVGMPPYYLHHITVESQEYTYLSGDEELGIELGKKVTFRYKETKKGLFIDKRSLGIVIDPSEFN